MVSNEFSVGFASAFCLTFVVHNTIVAKENPTAALLINLALCGLLVTNRVAGLIERLGGLSLRSFAVGFSAGSSIGLFVERGFERPKNSDFGNNIRVI